MKKEFSSIALSKRRAEKKHAVNVAPHVVFSAFRKSKACSNEQCFVERRSQDFFSISLSKIEHDRSLLFPCGARERGDP